MDANRAAEYILKPGWLDYFAIHTHNSDMGLDAVGIVMAVEEAFDIRIEDAEAETIRTPRHVINLVMGKVASASPPSGCITHRAFNQLRRVLVSRGGVSRQRISPAMQLSELLPRRNRRALVREITTDLSIRSPVALQRSAALASSLAAGSVVIGVGVGWFVPGGMAAFAGVCAAALAGGAGLRMT